MEEQKPLMPWEQDWKEKTKQAVSEAVDVIAPKTASGERLMPWERVWTMKERKSPTEASNGLPELSFDNVFNALIKQESLGQHFDENGRLLTSSVGAQGITQVMPATGQSPGYGVTPIQNNTKDEYIRFGKEYLGAMLKEFGGNWEKALAAYNAGPGNVHKAIAKAEERKGDWKDFLPKRTETLPYINNILKRFKNA